MPSSLALLPCLACMLLLAPAAHGSLMAVDLGGEFLKLSVVTPGRTPISVVINEMSKRKTPVLVGFDAGMRVLGEAAVTMAGRQPAKVIGSLRELLGKPAADPSVTQLLNSRHLNYPVVPDPERGTVMFDVLAGEPPVSIEEVVASELHYARMLASAHTSTSISSGVVLVPPYWGPAQRQALLDAAAIAGFEVLALLHSHAGAALQYGIERSFEAGKKEQVVMYDVSSSDVVASLVEYSAYQSGKDKWTSQFVVQDVTYAEGVGALDLDGAIAQHFVKEFEEKHGVTGLLGQGKVMARLKKPVRKAKEMMSANKESIPFHVEELHDGIDFASSIARDRFEELAGQYWSDVAAPLRELLERNNLTGSPVSVQLLGGGSRVPRVKAALESVAPGVVLERQLDADEASVLGAALYAANLSSTFRLRQFGMRDGNIYPVSMALESGTVVPAQLEMFLESNGGQVLVPFMQKLDSKRKVVLTDVVSDPLVLNLFLSGDRTPCCLNGKYINTIEVTGLSDVLERYGQTGKTSLHFTLNSFGLVQLVKAEAVVEYKEEVEVRAPKADSNNTNTSSPAEAGGADSNDTAPAADANQTDAPKVETTTKMVKRTKTAALKFTQTVHKEALQPLSQEQKAASRKRLASWLAREKAQKESERAKNELEGYIIKMRAALNDDEEVVQVTTEAQRGTFKAALDDAEDWIYMSPEADNAAATVYQDKLNTLLDMGSPIQVRVSEMQRRPERVTGARSMLGLVEKALNSWVTTKPWLDSSKVEELKTKAAEFQRWLDDVTQQQEQLQLHEDPVFKVEDLQNKFEAVSKMFAKMNSIPAPPPPPPPPQADNSTTENSTQDTTEAVGQESPAAEDGDNHDELR